MTHLTLSDFPLTPKDYPEDFEGENEMFWRAHTVKYKLFWMSCAECAMTQPMQPCEACQNYRKL